MYYVLTPRGVGPLPVSELTALICARYEHSDWTVWQEDLEEKTPDKKEN